MKPLPLNFRKNTFDYLQIWRDENYAIYSQFSEKGLIAYEVFKINKNKEFELHGNVIAASESVPSNEQWGVKAWTVKSLERAHEKIAELKQNNSAK